MRILKRFAGLGALAAGLALAGCAPTFGGLGPGLQLGITPSGSLSLGASSCALLGSGYAVPHGMSRTAAATSAIASIQEIQARYQLGFSDVRVQQQRWKRLAGGDC